MKRLSNLTNIMILLIFQVVMSGCAAVTVSTTLRVPEQRVPDRHRAIAMEFEKKGELRQALLRWEIVGTIVPEDAEVVQKISVLKALIYDSAEKFFKNGVANYKRKKLDEARRDFLLTLNLNPEHKDALDYLKNRLTGEDMLKYQIKKGDTLKSIAQKNYGDSEKAFLIAYFNNMTIDSKMTVNHEISIPVLESAMMGKQAVASYPDETMRKGTEAKAAIGEASSFFESKEYLRAIAITEKILQSNPSRKDARDLLNAACYERGKALMKEEKYQGAAAMFECAAPGYKDAANLAAISKKRLTDFHYIRGVELFMYEKLDEAIEEWEITLRIDPNHPKASSDIDNARSLLKKLKDIR